MHLPLLTTVIMASAIFGSALSWAAQPLTVYSYHNKPPYILTVPKPR